MKLKGKKVYFLLVLILLLSSFLLIYKLTEIPPSFEWDEASHCYNGYSLLKTGKDEFNQKYPILIRAFDAYLPPVLIYLNSISIFLFGFSEFSCRLPNAILGIFTSIGTFFLIIKLIGKYKLALLASFFLTLSPWHIIYSRVNIIAFPSVTFVIFAVLFFLLSIRNKKYIFLSLGFFILAILTYFTSYVFVPLFVLSLIILYRKKITIKRSLILILPLFLTVFALFFIFHGGKMRYQGVSSLQDPGLLKESSDLAKDEGVFGKIYHNRRLAYVQKLLEGYFSPLQFSFIFSKADSVRRMTVPGAGYGILFWFDFPFLILGLYFLIKKRLKGWLIIISWLFLGLIANAPTLPQPSSTRVTIVFPVLTIIVAYGFWNVVRLRGKLLNILLILLFMINLSLFTHQYFIHYPVVRSNDWFWEYKPLFSFLNSLENQNSKVFFVFSQPSFLDQVHIFTALYNKIDPVFYQQNGGTVLGKFGTTGEFSIGRFIFVPDYCKNCAKDIIQEKEDFVVTNKKIYVTPLKIISSLNNQETLFIYKIKEVPVDLLLSL